MRLLKTSITLLLSLFIFSAAFAASDESMYGELNGNTYQNQFFNFSLSIPQGWHPSSKQQMIALNEAGRKMIEAQTKNNQMLKDAMKAAETTKVNLFQVTAKPMGSPGNTMLRITAIKPATAPQNGQQVLDAVKFAMQKVIGFKKIKFTNLPPKNFGKVSFAHMQVTIPVGQLTINENFYAGIVKGYVIYIMAANAQGSDNSELQKMTESIKFN